MGAKTFPRGIHPGEYKEATASSKIRRVKIPEQVIVPMQQHIGAPCQPIVEKGDRVRTGQKIGESTGFVSAPVHASISGQVAGIEERRTPLGDVTPCVIIEADGEQEWAEGIGDQGTEIPSDPQDLRELIHEAGIVGLGGACFPTHVKLSPPDGKEIDTVILNGCECEPYLTGDQRLMLEEPDDIIQGLLFIMKILEVDRGYIGIEQNKPEAFSVMEERLKGEERVDVVSLKTKYPQGAEKMLIKALLNREVPSGGLPLDVGVVVNNVGTALAVNRAVRERMPLIERVVTVTGGNVQDPRNLKVRIGTTFREVVKNCGGLKTSGGQVIMGGPMMGKTQHSLDVPVIKGTSGIIFLTPDEVTDFESGPCIRCARCVDSCPVSLLPINLANYSEHGMWEELEDLNVVDCIECGSCTYVCPARRPLLHWIRLGKNKVMALRSSREE